MCCKRFEQVCQCTLGSQLRRPSGTGTLFPFYQFEPYPLVAKCATRTYLKIGPKDKAF